MGWSAAQAVAAHRPEDVIRAYLRLDRVAEHKPMLGVMARQRRAYHVVDDAELEAVSSSVHHEGVCLLVRPRAPAPLSALRDAHRDGAAVRALFLAGVENPNNVGAIVRSAAHFGARWILTDGASEAARTSAAIRTAEGGMEHVAFVPLEHVEAELAGLRNAGVALVATSSRARRSLFVAPLPRSAVFMMGAERDGLPPALTSLATHPLEIPGTGAVESLNVSTAAAIFLAEHWRTYGS
jgi:TrmH RNA methyltransferase